MKPLQGKVAVVAGATRGAGRGIACALGEAGAIVYCTGRSTRSKQTVKERSKEAAFDLAARPETIEETAEMVTARGGTGIYAQVDHTDESEVKALFERVKKEQGALHILVNDVWGGDELVEFGKPFWEASLDKGRVMIERAVFSHIITAHYAAPLLIETGDGLIVEITDGDGFYYRGNIFYDLVKTSVIRLAFAFARELRRCNVAVVAVTPGYLRSEAMLEYMGVTEANWQDAAEQEPNFIMSESPLYVGRAVAALATDPNITAKSGRVFSSWGLAEEYGFTDADGRSPNWGKFYEEKYGEPLKRCDDGFYEYWTGGPLDTIFKDWP